MKGDGAVSGFDVAADRLITFADNDMRPLAADAARLKSVVDGFRDIGDLPWPLVSGGLKLAYDKASKAYVEALDGFAAGLERSADVLKASAKEYEKRDGEINTALQGR
jgi:hypothetical protein